MKLLDVIQGSAEWHAQRGLFRGASTAGAMMGASSHTTRAELVRMKALGRTKEFSDWTQKYLLDKGLEIEALARPIVETQYGLEFYPATATDDGDYLVASFDGLTMDGQVVWECKSWNAALVEAVQKRELPPSHYWQLEHQLLVSGARYALFTVSDGTPERTLSMSYFAEPGRAAALMAGWKQFDEDVMNYKHVEVLPAPIAEPIKTLPALSVQLVGDVRSSNLAVYRESALTFIERIKTDLQTDQDFADAENTIKFCDSAEKELALVKKHALGQTASIDELFKTIDTLAEAMRQKRLMLDKLVKARKETIRAEILAEGQRAVAKHIEALNARLGNALMPKVVDNFAGVMKNKRTITSLRDAVDGEVARLKIAANEIADRIDANLKVYARAASGKDFLFRDLATLVQHPADAFKEMVELRVNQHDEQERQKQGAARERIAAEERAKIERAQAAKIAAEEKATRERFQAEQRAADALIAEAKAKAEAEAKRLSDVAAATLREEMATRRKAEEERETVLRMERQEMHARMNGRALLADFVKLYGSLPEFVDITRHINAFLQTEIVNG